MDKELDEIKVKLMDQKNELEDCNKQLERLANKVWKRFFVVVLFAVGSSIFVSFVVKDLYGNFYLNIAIDSLVLETERFWIMYLVILLVIGSLGILKNTYRAE